MQNKLIKALVLMSGGLDSMLAARILMEQGVAVTGIVFVSHFFGPAKARKAAAQLGIELKEIDFKEAHLAMVKNPKHGYGKNMNPCIDCHTMMMRYAKKIMEDEGYDFVATGEVLGQRPMSQNREALQTVNRESGLGDLLVRPMSAKLLDESRPEKEGLILRGKLYDIKGRSREKQKELVKKFGIKEYASPGGGCLLTDPGFSERLIRIFDYWPDCSGDEVELLKYGRIFWINVKNGKILIVVGRDKDECENLRRLAKKGDFIVELKDEIGPTTLIRDFAHGESGFNGKNCEITVDAPIVLKLSELKLGEEKNDEKVLNIAALLTGYYAVKARGKKSIIQLTIIN